MRSKSFADIKNQSEKHILSLRKSHSIEGLSVSVVSLESFSHLLSKKEDLEKKYFTVSELDYCKNRMSSLIGRYAAKLAVRDALQKQIPWKDMNILSSQVGEPVLSFSDKLTKLYYKKSIPDVAVSITHEENLVAALAGYSLKKSFAVGIDAASISRTAKLITQIKILQKILTRQEMKEIDDLQNGIAEKWAAKEAVSKAIGIGIWHGASLQNIEILTQNGKPFVKLGGKILEKANAKSLFNWNLSFIKNKSFVLAFVFATS